MIAVSAATLCFDAFADIDYVNTFEMAPKTGLRYLEFNCWFPRTITPMKTRDLRDRLSAAGLKASSVHCSVIGAEKSGLVRDVGHKIRCLEAAKELGAGLLCMSGGRRGSADGIEGVIRSLREVTPVAEALGMKIGLENHEGDNLENTEDYERVFEAIDSPAVGVCIDTGHFDAASVDMVDLIERVGDRVNHIHVKDNEKFGKKNFVFFGEGTTDNRGIVERMIARGYEGFIVLEISPQKDRPTKVEDVVKGFNMFREYERD